MEKVSRDSSVPGLSDRPGAVPLLALAAGCCCPMKFHYFYSLVKEDVQVLI